jgi:hypothetical protein
MSGSKPLSKEFNKRMRILWEAGGVSDVNFEQVSTVLLEIFADEYNKRHAPRKKKSEEKDK